MKKITTTILFLAIVMFACEFPNVRNNNKQQKTDTVETRLLPKLESDLMTPEVLWSFGRITEMDVSPDGNLIIFGVKYYNIKENKGNTDIYTVDVNGNFFKKLTSTPQSEFNIVFRPDGKKIAYISSESGELQMWEMDIDGTNKKQITNIKGGITGFKYDPTMKKILFTKEVKLDTTVHDMYPDLPKTSGKIFNDLMYRHWDTWCETYSHIFVADYAPNDSIYNIKDIMEAEQYNSPRKPFGGMEEISWSPDGKIIAFTSVKKKGLQYSLSTNSDIYLYYIDKDTTVNLTDGMPGYDACPVFSKNGKYIAWESMARDGYESDKNRLFIYNFETGEKKDYTENFDQNVHNLKWKGNYKIYFTSEWHGTKEIYELALNTGEIRKITNGIHNYLNVFISANGLVAMKHSMSMPTEIFSVNPKTGNEKQITFVNKELLSKIKMGEVKKRWIKTFDGKDMLVWVIYPPHFDSTKTYPALLYCQGGPQSMVSQFWSYRWNFQIMAANGYIIVAPNRRGLPGFGQEWNEQISGDYGGKNMKDYLTAIDELAKEPYIDKNRLGAVGASYGGFSVFWLAGHHNGRFKAFIAHDGMFNLEAQYLETDELWFVNWDLGGPYWEKNNRKVQHSYSNSPHKFVEKWDTPILIIHGGKDYRILDSQGFQAFNAAIIRGIPAKMLYFPDENHWVLKPQNGILWQRTFFKWLDKWLKNNNSEQV